MVIAFGNTKGGVGSSTLALLLAQYLSSVPGLHTSLIDLRENRGLEGLSSRSGLVEHQPIFDFFACDLSRLDPLMQRLGQSAKGVMVLDLPALLYDEKLTALIAKLNQLIIPFSYERATLDASIYFAAFCRRINPSLSILFIPNRIHHSAIYEFREEVDTVLRKMGGVSPAILEHIGFQRIGSLDLPIELCQRVLPVLELIYHQYLKNNMSNNFSLYP
ncbi:ParA family protein [Pedobacter frigidisoli]|uniref:ParA family protein n=1 Tax=Pedobacter frigidisoli TaxID=2530455 RepID=A0A4R0P3E3_9SPHI|nr:ParA family protein [Pedobacter frigidisoli]TCD07684.1 ParA family protein [Pedobacter frigidisoli]